MSKTQEKDGSTALAEERTIARDIRVDQIGFVGELQKQFVEPLKATLKARMGERQIDVCEGEYFSALLVEGGTLSVVDAGKFVRLYESKSITRAEFLSAIAVRNDPCRAFLSGKELAAISEQTPASPQLRVSRKKGVEVRLVDAVKGIASAIKEDC
jgi:hypothetical protein